MLKLESFIHHQEVAGGEVLLVLLNENGVRELH